VSASPNLLDKSLRYGIVPERTGQGKSGEGRSRTGAAVVVLVVEDEVLVRAWVIDVLEEADLEFAVASNGDEAVRILDERSDIGIVFTDVNMPGSIDGISLAKLVRERWPAIPVILTSALAVPSGFVFDERMIFMPKPYDAAKLVEALQAFGTGGGGKPRTNILHRGQLPRD
jgi:two-component system, response regulator PdtaR